MMSFTGRLRPKVKGYLFQASGIKRVEISLVEVLKVGKSVIWVYERAQKGVKVEFYCF